MFASDNKENKVVQIEEAVVELNNNNVQNNENVHSIKEQISQEEPKEKENSLSVQNEIIKDSFTIDSEKKENTVENDDNENNDQTDINRDNIDTQINNVGPNNPPFCIPYGYPYFPMGYYPPPQTGFQPMPEQLSQMYLCQQMYMQQFYQMNQMYNNRPYYNNKLFK